VQLTCAGRADLPSSANSRAAACDSAAIDPAQTRVPVPCRFTRSWAPALAAATLAWMQVRVRTAAAAAPLALQSRAKLTSCTTAHCLVRLAHASCLQLLPMHKMRLFSTLAGGVYARLPVGTPCAMGSGTVWAGNLLKPMLGRGELRCIGATTIAEYRKYIEKVNLAHHHRGSVFTSCPQK